MIAIDLGSNTIRVLKVDCSNQKRLYSFERAVKTADNLHKTKKVSNGAKERVIKALLDSQKEIDFSEDRVVAFTTEALRQAQNRDEFLADILEQTGVRFKIISSDLEASLTLLSAKEALKRLKIEKSFTLLDIGGGSSEFTFYSKEKTISKSFQIGIVTVAQKYRTKEQIEKNLDFEFREAREFIEQNRGLKGDIFVATAGTPTTVANMKIGLDYATYDYKRVTGVELSVDDLDESLEILLESSEKEQKRLVGDNRADLIIAGILIYKKVYELLGFSKSIVVDDGLREGIALAKCKGII